jgi:predicted nicotinamide N-methyase
MTKRIFLGTTTSLAKVVARTDVQVNVYEGGFKLWECGVDLVGYLRDAVHASTSSSSSSPTSLTIKGRRILELGCGHGLPAVYCLRHEPSLVVLQDLNIEVLQNCALPAVLLNSSLTLKDLTSSPSDAKSSSLASPSLSSLPRVEFYSGAWSTQGLRTLMGSISSGGGGTFDIILSSDTLYSSASMPHLITLIAHHLRANGDGVALIAAKRFYFGVGGSTAEFMSRIRSWPFEPPLYGTHPNGGTLTASIVRVLEDGASNIREIIAVRRLSPITPTV